MDNKPKKTIKQKKKYKTNIKNKGVNIDKNEYYEIVLSQSNNPNNYR